MVLIIKLCTKLFLLLGFYCLEGCTTPLPCPAGSASMIESQLDCSPCPPGFYCITSALISPTGPCSAGQWHRNSH